MLIVFLALLQAATAPDVTTVDRLPLDEATRVVLKGKDHGPIIAVEPDVPPMPGVGGEAARAFLEGPLRLQQGCRRRRWFAEFMPPRWLVSPLGPEDGRPPVLHSVTVRNEVALLHNGACPTTDYANISDETDAQAAIDALSRLAQVRAAVTSVEFDCRDFTPSKLCTDKNVILSEIASLVPSHIYRRDATIVISLAGHPRWATDVIVDPATPGRVGISRHVPPVS